MHGSNDTTDIVVIGVALAAGAVAACRAPTPPSITRPSATDLADRPFTPSVADAIDTGGWLHTITTDAGPRIWMHDRAALTIARVARSHDAGSRRSVA